jgi:hypothetical protein
MDPTTTTRTAGSLGDRRGGHPSRPGAAAYKASITTSTAITQASTVNAIANSRGGP